MLSSKIHSLTTLGLGDAKLFGTSLLVYATYRYVLTHAVFPKLGQICKIDPKRNYKWSNRCFDLLHYVTSLLLGVFAILGRPYAHSFIWAPSYGSLIIPNPQAFECSVAEKVYVMMFLCYYIVDVFYLGSQSDEFFTGLHHVATLSLITGSIYLRQAPVCIAIMVLHDVVDVPLYTGKIATYLGYEKVKSVALLTFAVLCTWFRIINYPIIAFQSTMSANTVEFAQKAFKADCTFLWVLYICHIKWFLDILKAVKEIIVGKPDAIRDNRSD